MSTLNAAVADCAGTIPQDLTRIDQWIGCELPADLPDPRGDELVGTNGKTIGRITDLLVSPSTNSAYFAVVEAGSWMNHHEYAVPLAMITVQNGEARVSVTHHRFADAPEWRSEAPDYATICAYWQGKHLRESK
jgi:hypothetical protein